MCVQPQMRSNTLTAVSQSGFFLLNMWNKLKNRNLSLLCSWKVTYIFKFILLTIPGGNKTPTIPQNSNTADYPSVQCRDTWPLTSWLSPSLTSLMCLQFVWLQSQENHMSERTLQQHLWFLTHSCRLHSSWDKPRLRQDVQTLKELSIHFILETNRQQKDHVQ